LLDSTKKQTTHPCNGLLNSLNVQLGILCLVLVHLASSSLHISCHLVLVSALGNKGLCELVQGLNAGKALVGIKLLLDELQEGVQAAALVVTAGRNSSATEMSVAT
jgi:hypothetical protein